MGEIDLHLFSEGTICRSMNSRRAPRTMDGVEGVILRLAPNAQRVSVVGDFMVGMAGQIDAPAGNGCGIVFAGYE